jgi:hypothetical protein
MNKSYMRRWEHHHADKNTSIMQFVAATEA